MSEVKSGIESLFEDGDPFDLPSWQTAELMAKAPPRPGKGYGIYSLAYMARVLPLASGPAQLAVMLLLYGRCVRQRRVTVDLSNGEFEALGVSRQAKYSTLAKFQEAGALIVEARNGRSVRVTLRWFP